MAFRSRDLLKRIEIKKKKKEDEEDDPFSFL